MRSIFLPQPNSYFSIFCVRQLGCLMTVREDIWGKIKQNYPYVLGIPFNVETAGQLSF